MLAWSLTDLDHVTLATLTDRRLGRWAWRLNDAREASVTISLDDVAALKVLPLRALLKVWLDGQLIFTGRLTSPTFSDDAGAGEAGASVPIVARDPFDHLTRCYTHDSAALTFAGIDQSTILQALIDHVAANGHGIVAGDLWTAGADRDRTYYDGKQIAEALVQMSEVIGGPDFEVAPSDGPAELGFFNTYEAMGAARAAVFEYGFGLHNVAGFAYAPSGESVCNKFTAVGTAIDGAAPAYVAESPGSQAFFGGVFERYEVVNDVSEAATLEDYAKEQVRRYAYPLDLFDLTLPPQGVLADVEAVDFAGAVYGEPPTCGPLADYWMGDTITARIRRTIDVNVRGRIEQLELTEDDQGAVTAKLTCSPIANEATDVTGAAITVQVEAPPVP